MSTQTFTWKRAPGSQGTLNFAIWEAKFGDGYGQVAKNGINNVSQTWPVTIEGNLSYCQPAYDFLKAHAGATSFYWTPPGGTESYFRAKKFTMTSVGGDVYSVTAEFEQSFMP